MEREEEAASVAEAQAGDAGAKKRLIETHMRLVVSIAKTYPSKIPLDDLVVEGVTGLTQAIERFNPEKGLRFSIYPIHWVRQAIGRAIDNASKKDD